MALQVPLLRCPIFEPMIDCWHGVKLEMLFAVIVLLNTCTVLITEVTSPWSPRRRIYDPNLPPKQLHLDTLPLGLQKASESLFYLYIFSQSPSIKPHRRLPL